MFIKNALRLFINNINLCFKPMLIRLIITAVGLAAIYGISYAGLAVILKSEEFKNVLRGVRQIWQQFINSNIVRSVDISDSLRALGSLVYSNIGRVIWSMVAVIVVLVAMNFLLGVCNYVLGVMVDTYMTSLTKTHFTQTLLLNLKKATLFELLNTVVKVLFFAVLFAVCVGFVALTGRVLGLLSIIIVIWGAVSLCAVFMTLTVRIRPKVIRGATVREAVRTASVGKRNFSSIFATFIITVVAAICLNVMMIFTTFGAGIVVSVPLSCLALVCLQNVVEYTLSGNKYYIDYDNIIIPKELRGEEEKLLDDVDI